jgi:sulfatase modifying factor 1
MMKTKTLISCAATIALISTASATVTMDWVTVGNANNAADTLTGYGSVGYAYQIGKYEVTNAQYGAFLNAKGQSNTNNIYNASMSGYGITQSGDSGSYSYTVTSALANRPVVYVSWYDAARFANWMMNGQGSSDMESGAYTLNNSTSGIFLANASAQVYLPSEDEWYKAAYYNGANSTYSLYPNGQNSITIADANYDDSFGYRTNVGTYSADPSSYGTFDQGGNVWEWNGAVIFGMFHGRRGGAWNTYGGYDLLSSDRSFNGPANEDNNVGFRLASVPEPTSIVLTMLAGGMMLIRRKR